MRALLILVGSILVYAQQAAAYTEFVCGVTDRSYIYDGRGPTKEAAANFVKKYCIAKSTSPRRCGSATCRKVVQRTVPRHPLAMISVETIGSYAPGSGSGHGGGGGSSHPSTGSEEKPEPRESKPEYCPDGKYHSGGCNYCPDGKYHGGDGCHYGPDGEYHGSQPTYCPDGKYHDGGCVYCPDGKYHGGTKCNYAPDGQYHGDGGD